ncbi:MULTISPECIES: hypothetical protein [unclassified Bacillus (in: firmicutes)]
MLDILLNISSAVLSDIHFCNPAPGITE